MKDLIEEVERWDLEPKLASLWWTNTCACEEMEDITICTRTGRQQTFREKFQDSGSLFQYQAGTDARLLVRKNTKCKQGPLEGCEDLQEQKCAVEVKCRRMVEHVCSVFCFGRENWSGIKSSWTELRDGKHRPRSVCSDSTRKRTRLWQNTTQGRRGWQERFGHI